MDALNVVAIAISGVSAVGVVYSVVISRRALDWQKQRDAERAKPHIRVQFEHAAEVVHSYVHNLNDPDPRPEPLFYELSVSVINDGETTEHLRSLWIESVDGVQGLDLTKDRHADRELHPRARIAIPVKLSDVPDAERGFVAIARLAGGHEVTSEVDRPLDDIVDHIEQHNRKARP